MIGAWEGELTFSLLVLIFREIDVMAGSFSLQWHITNNCDQRCKHCYIFSTKNNPQEIDWSFSEFVKVLDDYEDFCRIYDKTKFVVLTGGDPILHPYFWEFVKELSVRKIQFAVLGNPFNITAADAIKLEELGSRGYQMSIDGLESTHDLMRRPGSFTTTIQKIKELKAAGARVTIMTTVSKINYTELPKIASLVSSLNVDSFAFSRYCPTHNDTDFNLTPSEYRGLLQEMWELYQELSRNGSKTSFSLKDHLWAPFLYEIGEYGIDVGMDRVIYDGCHCGISHLCILENGQVYACRRFNSPVGIVPRQRIEDIFFSDEMERYRETDKISKCNDCKLYGYCRGCRAVAYGTSGGDYYAEDPQCWFSRESV